ncbi:DUF2993 domain-containing protein [Synechococcus sp. PCC 7336]|uniref:LmeA family phospholipid-binding protein n=1 Tax=Synechococcus sp. PCC 7336 TaxID=195250 RepID=UPI00034761A0|nr:DUF2993 domain-containing protein [Synechococcus sp. PCC 7336]
MFGGLPFSGQGGDRIVSKAVTAAIAALFERTEKLEANVRAEPVAKLLQGSIDSFELISNSMLMYNGLRIESMELYLQSVAIDFGAIFQGQVKLRQPTQATMRVVLTQDDLTTSFNTPFVIDKLQRLQFREQPLHFQNTEMTLNDDKSLRIQSQIQIGNAGEPVAVDFTARLQTEDRRKIRFVDVTYAGEAAAVELGQAIVAHVNQLLDLDKFALDGTQLRVDRVRQQKQQLIFYGIAQIERFPRRDSKSAA